MTSPDIIAADMKQLLDSFDHFINLIELENWLKNITVEDVKRSFKLSRFIEESINKLQEKQGLDIFTEILIKWWKTKGRTKVYSMETFKIASDYMLSKFFTCKFIPVNTLDIAVRMYTTMYPKRRFQKFLEKSILESASIEALIDCTVDNKGSINLKQLECRFLLRHWATEVECGRRNDVIEIIKNMLSNYKIKISLDTLITMLALDDVSSEELNIKDIILEELRLRMVDRSILSKHLWISLFTCVDKRCLGRACDLFEELLNELFNFIIYIGCMMVAEVKSSETSWTSDSDVSICPELTYDNVLCLIKSLCDCNVNLKEYTKVRISQAKVLTTSEIWAQLEKDALIQ